MIENKNTTKDKPEAQLQMLTFSIQAFRVQRKNSVSYLFRELAN